MVDQPAASRNYVWRALELFAAYGSAEAVIYRDRRFTFDELGTMTRTLAASLRAHGVRPGSAVAVLTGNPPQSVTLQLALHLLGCRSVWIGLAPRSHQVDFLTRAQVDAFVYNVDTHAEAGRDLAGVLGSLPVFCLGAGGIGPDLLAGWSPDVEQGLDELTVGVQTEPQSLFQTSGTTGRPKLVHHRHLLFQVLPVLAQRWVDEGRPVLRHLSIHGFWHVASQMTTLMVLFMGGTVVMSEPIDAGEFLRLVQRERINSTVVAPPVLYELLDHPSLEQTDTSTLLVITCGGAATAPARLAEAIERLGPIVRVVYAMSESPGITELPAVNHDPQHPERLRSCGLPYGDVRVQVRGSDGELVAAGEVGEVWVASALVMAGYWGQPELTAHTLVDGWLRTRDLGYLDADGYLYLVDRTDDVIFTGRGSMNVYSRPIEDALLGHPDVRAAAVIRVPDDALGEAGHAYVVLAPGSGATAAQLRDRVIAELNATWAPREIEFVDELPMVGMGKVDKKALQRRFDAAHPAAAAVTA